MRTICIVQSRLSSQRFPRKALADLNGRSLIWHVVNRAMQIRGVDRVVVAVPYRDVGPMVEVLGARMSVFGWRGDEADVLARFAAVAHRYEAEILVRLTGDCPVLDPVVACQVLELFHASQPCDFASNDTLISGYPDGFDVEVFSRAALERAAAEATVPADREHVTPWMKRNLRCVTLYNPEPWTGPKKLSVDEPSDLETVRTWLISQSQSL